jgi:hypothetical protein
VTRARACAQDAQPSESAAKDPADGECFDDGGACATSPFVLVWPESTQQLIGGCTAAHLLASPTISNSASTSLHSFKQQVDATLKAHVVSICFKCFRCFISMLQVFYMDVTKVDREVAYVIMVVHVCCQLLFSCFICFLELYYVVSVLFGCCIHFHVYVASVLSGCYVCLCNSFKYFSGVSVSVSDACFKCFICL